MPALAGEPFRGCAFIDMRDVALAVGHRFTAYIDAGFNPAAPGDNTTWEGEAGGTLTLRAKWEKPALDLQAPTRFDVRVMTPAGGQIGVTWSVPIQLNVEQTRTLRFDLDPLDEDALDAVRAGMLEVFIEVQSTGGLDPWGPYDSRGTQTDSPLSVIPGNSRWARGYVRARSKLSSFAISNASLGGAEPASFAYKDTTFNRVVLDADLYRAEQVTLEHRNGASVIRSQADAAATTPTRDYTWNATSGATSRVHNAGSGSGGAYPNGAAGVRVVLPVRDFGGDNETQWAASGHLAGWSVIDGRTLEEPDRITVNPTLTCTRHMQLNDNAFGTPPGSKNVGQERLTADLGFVAARVLNARAEGINQAAGANLGVSYSLRDDGNLVSAVTTTDQATATQGGEAGWGPLMAWSNGLPGGGWTNAVTFKDEAGTQGTASHAFTLLAADPRVAVEVIVEPSVEPKNHASPGDQLRITAKLRRLTATLAPDVGSMKLSLSRIRGGKAQHYDGAAWVDTGSGSITELSMTASAQDANVFERLVSTDSTWGYGDVTAQINFKVNGTPYAMRQVEPFLADANRHAKHAFDPTGLFK